MEASKVKEQKPVRPVAYKDTEPIIQDPAHLLERTTDLGHDAATKIEAETTRAASFIFREIVKMIEEPSFELQDALATILSEHLTELTERLADIHAAHQYEVNTLLTAEVKQRYGYISGLAKGRFFGQIMAEDIKIPHVAVNLHGISLSDGNCVDTKSAGVALDPFSRNGAKEPNVQKGQSYRTRNSVSKEAAEKKKALSQSQ